MFPNHTILQISTLAIARIARTRQTDPQWVGSLAEVKPMELAGLERNMFEPMRRMCAGCIVVALGGAAMAAGLSVADRAKIDEALPAKAPARVKRARRLLILNVNVNDPGRRPDIHQSIPHANYAIEAMGQKTGAYTTVLSTEIEALRPGQPAALRRHLLQQHHGRTHR